MMQDVAEGLSARGHKVTVVTAKPHADLNLTKDQLDTSYDTYSIENKVHVIRAETPPLKSKMYVLRGVIQLLLPYIFFKQIKKYSKGRFDIVIISTPPLPLARLGMIMKKKYKSKFILFIQDIYPESLIDIGAMKNKLIINYFKKLAQDAYDSADILTSHTKGNRSFIIINNKIHPKKISYLPNWIDVTSYNNHQKSAKYREIFGLEDKFIFLFAGIIGKGQGLETIVKSLTLSKNLPKELCFLIVGEGSEKSIIEVIAKNCRHIVFKPLVSLEEYPSLVKNVDVGVVCLDSRLKTPVVPGKLLGFMAASLPVIAFLNKESDGHTIIKEANCGYSINSDSSFENINSLVLKILNEKDKLKDFGKNGYQYLLENYSKAACINKINNFIDTND